MENNVNFRFGKNARMEIARPLDGMEAPALNDYVYFCLTNQISIGLSKGSVTIDTFCTGGEVEVPDGSSTGTLEFGDTTWAENDAALKILEDAAFSDTEDGSTLFYAVYPIGKKEGAPMFRGQLMVNEWKLDMPSKGVIKVTNGVRAYGKPERGTFTGGVFIPNPKDTVAGVQTIELVSGVAQPATDYTAGQVRKYTITTAQPQDIEFKTTGADGDVDLRVYDANSYLVAQGSTVGSNETVNLQAAPAGIYTAHVVAVKAASDVVITATTSAPTP